MQSDEVVWQIINHSHCSYKTRGNEKENFCRNKYNVTGLCNRSSCPLANSQYATILEDEGKLSLLTKTVERAHTPAKLWEKIELDANYSLALEQVSKTLRHWPKFLVHKNKQRLTKLVQFLIRSRRLNKHVKQDIVTIPSRELKREQRNELKAEKAAKLQSSIERELLERLSSGTYNSAYNFVTSAYDQELHHTSLWSEQQTPSKRKRSTRSHQEIEFEVENDLEKL